MRRWIVLGLMLGLASCASERRSATRLDEARAIEIARREVRARETWASRAKYSATRNDDGWSIFVVRVEGRSPEGEDLVVPGGHRMVMINGQGKVTDYHLGE